MTTLRAECPVCHADISVNQDSTLRTHHGADGHPCPGGNPPKSTGASVEEKAKRLLVEGKVRVRSVHNGSAVVLVQGSHPEPYEVVFAGGSWRCPCDAHVWRCSHVVAAQSVVDTPTLHHTTVDEIDALLGA